MLTSVMVRRRVDGAPPELCRLKRDGDRMVVNVTDNKTVLWSLEDIWDLDSVIRLTWSDPFNWSDICSWETKLT